MTRWTGGAAFYIGALFDALVLFVVVFMVVLIVAYLAVMIAEQF